MKFCLKGLKTVRVIAAAVVILVVIVGAVVQLLIIEYKYCVHQNLKSASKFARIVISTA